MAVTRSVPSGNAVVVSVAWKVPPLAGAKTTDPRFVVPVTNFTVPVGMPTPVEATVMLKVTDVPESALKGLIFGVVIAMVEVVGAVVTVIDRMDEVLPSKELVPR